MTSFDQYSPRSIKENPAFNDEIGLIDRIPTKSELIAAGYGNPAENAGAKARALAQAGVEAPQTETTSGPFTRIVQRSDGTLDPGWQALKKNGDGTITMWKLDPNNPDTELTKVVPWQKLSEWDKAYKEQTGQSGS